MLDAMGDVVARSPPRRGAVPPRGGSASHVDAVAVVLDHPRRGRDLAFDSFQLFRQEVLISVRMRLIYPPRVVYSSGPGEFR